MPVLGLGRPEWAWPSARSRDLWSGKALYPAHPQAIV